VTLHGRRRHKKWAHSLVFFLGGRAPLTAQDGD
jgi:hypothetical protein